MSDSMLISADRLIRVHDRTFAPYISKEEISVLVDKIARNINHDYVGKELVVLVVLKGAMMFASDLLRRLRVPCVIETLRASSYRTGMTSGSIDIEDALPNVSNRHVLIVEDIVDTGNTLRELVKVLSGMAPASVTVTALVCKPDAQPDPIIIDYVGKEIDTDFVVGYGMDYAGYGRELDAIWVLVPQDEINDRT